VQSLSLLSWFLHLIVFFRLRRLNRLKIFAKTNKILSGAKTRKEAIEIAREEFVRREKSKNC